MASLFRLCASFYMDYFSMLINSKLFSGPGDRTSAAAWRAVGHLGQPPLAGQHARLGSRPAGRECHPQQSSRRRADTLRRASSPDRVARGTAPHDRASPGPQPCDGTVAAVSAVLGVAPVAAPCYWYFLTLLLLF